MNKVKYTIMFIYIMYIPSKGKSELQYTSHYVGMKNMRMHTIASLENHCFPLIYFSLISKKVH